MVAFPLAGMVNAKLFLDFLKMSLKNKSLLNTIKNILNVLPDGVLIHTIEGGSKIQFSNSWVHKQLFTHKDITNLSLSDIQLRCELLSAQNNEDSCEPEIHSISDILSLSESEIEMKTDHIVTSQVSPTYLEEDLQHRNDVVYNVKSIKIDWVDSMSAYLHVFSDITSLKQFEKQKATNKVMHIMFSSVSHELRTPLNWFANSLNLIEDNFRDLKDWFTKNSSQVFHYSNTI